MSIKFYKIHITTFINYLESQVYPSLSVYVFFICKKSWEVYCKRLHRPLPFLNNESTFFRRFSSQPWRVFHVKFWCKFSLTLLLKIYTIFAVRSAPPIDWKRTLTQLILIFFFRLCNLTRSITKYHLDMQIMIDNRSSFLIWVFVLKF